jgi:2-succinyl-6-hydroxy-2,4-cyclohexadiene-1-carboxylate synthase
MRCVLLHGFAGDPAAWDDVVAHGVRGDALALPGHGGEPVRESWDDNLAAIDVSPSDLVIGYSLGARVALGLVATGRCARAILISVNPGIDDGERATRRLSDAAWVSLLRTRGIAAFVDAWQAQPLFASQARVDVDKLANRRARRLRHDPEQLARSLEVMGLAEMPDYRRAVAANRVALVAGADDAKYVAIAHQTGVAFVTIPRSGHDPTLEQPAELARVIADLV